MKETVSESRTEMTVNVRACREILLYSNILHLNPTTVVLNVTSILDSLQDSLRLYLEGEMPHSHLESNILLLVSRLWICSDDSFYPLLNESYREQINAIREHVRKEMAISFQYRYRKALTSPSVFQEILPVPSSGSP